MNRIGVAFLPVIVFLWMTEPLAARPEYMLRFTEDAFRRADVDGCSTCHINPNGGGPRNPFGSAFQAEDHNITPMLRSNFPDRFEFQSTEIADGSVFHFADPESEFVVFERDGQKHVFDLVALSVVAEVEEAAPPEFGNVTSFFLTSVGLGQGAKLGGLAGADRHCQGLAEAVGAGAKTWHAYLSTSIGDSAAVNAGDRIGSGPWYNAKGSMVARGVVELHTGGYLGKAMALNEMGEVVSGRGDDPNRHDVLTGTLADGTAAVGANCDNWTSNGEGSAMVGHHDRDGRGDTGSSWNSAHPSSGCSQEALRGSGGDGLLYCFAIQ